MLRCDCCPEEHGGAGISLRFLSQFLLATYPGVNNHTRTVVLFVTVEDPLTVPHSGDPEFVLLRQSARHPFSPQPDSRLLSFYF